MRTFFSLREEIKGWKHAGRDIQKMRAEQGKDVYLRPLNKNGEESKMNNSKKLFSSEAEAREHHERMKKLNPKSKIRHNLYVDFKHKETLE